ncbi:MAG: hypothetical protein IPL61_28455 [Myxococcales bacterium]|nr:hypothetical protein [Myxococcales bacterium]
MQLRSLLAVACLGLAVAAAPRPAAACSKRHESIFELFDGAVDVAVVKVGAVPGRRYAGRVALRVKQGLKGARRGTITARETNSSCSTGFRSGRTALVFIAKDRWPAGSFEGYIEKPSPALVATLTAWAQPQSDVDRAGLLVAAIASPERALRRDAAWHLVNHPELIAALTADQTAALVAARGTDGTGRMVAMILARQHGQAWRDLVAAGGLPPRTPALTVLAAQDFERVTDVGVLADVIARTPGERAPERIAALERCERVHGAQLEAFTSYSGGHAEPWWLKLAEACRTGAPVAW